MKFLQDNKPTPLRPSLLLDSHTAERVVQSGENVAVQIVFLFVEKAFSCRDNGGPLRWQRFQTSALFVRCIDLDAELVGYCTRCLPPFPFRHWVRVIGWMHRIGPVLGRMHNAPPGATPAPVSAAPSRASRRRRSTTNDDASLQRRHNKTAE